MAAAVLACCVAVLDGVLSTGAVAGAVLLMVEAAAVVLTLPAAPSAAPPPPPPPPQAASIVAMAEAEPERRKRRRFIVGLRMGPGVATSRLAGAGLQVLEASGGRAEDRRRAQRSARSRDCSVVLVLQPG